MPSHSHGPRDQRATAMQRRKIIAGTARMDGKKEVVVKECVLLDNENLKSAAMKLTAGGKKDFNGLYLSTGARIEEKGDDGAKVHNENAQDAQNLSRVARTYNARAAKEQKKATASGKSKEDYDDAASARKAKKILSKCGEADQGSFREMFKFFDTDGDRTWGSIEFAQRMTDIGYTTTIEEASNLLYFAGVRDVDRITYNDFIALMPKLKAYRILLEKDAMRAFQSFDDGSGYLSLKALTECLHTIAGPGGMSDEDVHDFVLRANREGTGRIPFAFFIRAMFGTPPVIEYEPVKQASWLARLFGCGAKYQAPAIEDDEDEPEENAPAAGHGQSAWAEKAKKQGGSKSSLSASSK